MPKYSLNVFGTNYDIDSDRDLSDDELRTHAQSLMGKQDSISKPPTPSTDNGYDASTGLLPGWLKEGASKVMGTIGLPARAGSMAVDVASAEAQRAAAQEPREISSDEKDARMVRALRSNAVPGADIMDQPAQDPSQPVRMGTETVVEPGANLITGEGVHTPGMGAQSLKGLQDIGNLQINGLSVEPDASAAQTVGERKAANKKLFEGAGTLGRVGKFATSGAEIATGMALDPAVAMLGPLGEASQSSLMAKRVFTGLQRTMQAGMGVDSVEGLHDYWAAGNKYGWNSPQADDVGAQVLTNIGSILGLEVAGHLGKKAAEAGKASDTIQPFDHEFPEPTAPAIEEHFGSGEAAKPELLDYTGTAPEDRQHAPKDFDTDFTPPPVRPEGLEAQLQAKKEALKGKPIDELLPPIAPEAAPSSNIRSPREQSLVDQVNERLDYEGLEKGTPERLARGKEMLAEGGLRKGPRAEMLAENVREEAPREEPMEVVHEDELTPPSAIREYRGEINEGANNAPEASVAHLNRVLQSDTGRKVYDALEGAVGMLDPALVTGPGKAQAGEFGGMGADFADTNSRIHGFSQNERSHVDIASIAAEAVHKGGIEAEDNGADRGQATVDYFVNKLLDNYVHEFTHGRTGARHNNMPYGESGMTHNEAFHELFDAMKDKTSEQRRLLETQLKKQINLDDVLQLKRMEQVFHSEASREQRGNGVDANAMVETNKASEPPEWKQLDLDELREKNNREEGSTPLFHALARNLIEGGREVVRNPGGALKQVARTSEQLYQAALAGGFRTAERNVVAASAEGGLMAMADGLQAIRHTLTGNKEMAGEHTAKLQQRVKNIASGHLLTSLADTMGMMVGKELPGRVAGDNRTLEAMGSDLVPTDLHERFRHLMASDVQTATGSRQLTKTEATGRFMMIFNELQERSARLGVMKVELAPVMKKFAAKDYNDLWQKAQDDPIARVEIGDALAKAETAALERTKGLGPSGTKYGQQPYGSTAQGEIARKATAFLNSIPGVKIVTPFTNYTINNFIVNLLEKNPITANLTERGNKGIMNAYEGDIQGLKGSIGDLRTIRKQRLDLEKQARDQYKTLDDSIQLKLQNAVPGQKGKIRSQGFKDLRDLKQQWEQKIQPLRQKEYAKQSDVVGLRNKTEKMQSGGVYSGSYRAALTTTGPLLIGLGMLARMRRGEDGLDALQTPGEKDEKGNKRVRNLSSLVGGASPYLMVGDYLARTYLLKSDYYNGRTGKKALESVQGGGAGRPGPGDIVAAAGEGDQKFADVVRKWASGVGAGFGKMAWLGDVLDAARESQLGKKQTGKRPDLTRTPSKEGVLLQPLKRGLESKVAPEKVQDAYDSSSGEKREIPAFWDTVLHLGASEQKLSPLSQFVQRHPDISPAAVFMKQAGVPEWDDARYKVFRERLEKEVVPVIEDESMPDNVKKQFVQTRIRNIITNAGAEAKRSLPPTLVPESVRAQTEKKVQGEQVRRENRKLFRAPKHSGGLKKREEKKFEKALSESTTEGDHS